MVNTNFTFEQEKHYLIEDISNYEFVVDIKNYYKVPRHKIYLADKFSLKYIDELEQEKIPAFEELVVDSLHSLDHFVGFDLYDDEGKKLSDFFNLKDKQIFKTLTKNNGGHLIKMTPSDVKKCLNHDLLLLNLRKDFPKKETFIYSLEKARNDVINGYNRIADYGFVNDLNTVIYGFDHRENKVKKLQYQTFKYPTLSTYEERLKDMLSNTDAILEGIKRDDFMIENLTRRGYNCEEYLKSSDLYITERNPIHLMHSLARYGLAPYQQEDISDIDDNWLKWIYFYTYNLYLNVGLESWRPDEKLHQFNGTSSPGYLYNRLFQNNVDLSLISKEVVKLFEDTVAMGIIPAAICCHFEKQCVQEKAKISEIRTISHAPIHHTLVGKKYVHVIENAFIVNQDVSDLCIGQNIYNGGMDDFYRSSKVSPDYCHRQEDYSKQDNHENPVLMDVLMQARVDISGMTMREKKIYTCIEEHNRNPIRVTPFGQVYKSCYCKPSGGAATCMNNCDKHMAVNSLEHALVICEQEDIEFEPKNFKLILEIMLSKKYCSHKTFSDDSCKTIRKDLKGYFMTPDYNLSLQDKILGKFGLLIKKSKLNYFSENYFTAEDFSVMGPKWLGNYIIKKDNRVLPCRPISKLIFGMCTFNPESKLANIIIDDPKNIIGWAYRLSKLFSYMVNCLNNFELFNAFKSIRDDLVAYIRVNFANVEKELEKMFNNGEFDEFSSIFVELHNIGGLGKTPEIWEYQDFFDFVTSHSFKKTVSEFINNVLYHVERNGIDFSEGNNPLIQLLNNLGYNIYNNPDSKFSASEYPRLSSIFSKKCYPFLGISQKNITDIVRRNYYSFSTTSIEGVMNELNLKHFMRSIGIEFYNEDPEKFDNYNTHFISMLKLDNWINLLIDNTDNSRRVFFLEPSIGFLMYQRKKFVFNNGFKITYGEIGTIKTVEYGKIFDRFRIKQRFTFEPNFDIIELTLRRDEISNGIRLFNNLSLTNKSIDAFIEYGIPYFGIEKDSRMFFTALKILEQSTLHDNRLYNYFNDVNETTSENLNCELFDGVKLNSKFLQFINGGPGCGKTQIIVEMAGELINQFNKVCITASTNEQIINICERLLNEKIQYNLVVSLKTCENLPVMAQLRRSSNLKAKIVIGTTAMFYRSSSFRNCRCVVIDEVTKCTIGEITLMLSSVHMRHKTEKLILLGDKYQSTIYNPMKIQNFFMQSFVDEIRSEDHSYLSVTKRFGNNTCKALNMIGYREQPLTSIVKFEDEISCIYTCSGLDCSCYEKVYINDQEESSYGNLKNVDYVVSEKLHEEYKIIVPYNAQKIIYSKVGIEAITIDSSQGKEYDQVLLDLTRCNPHGNIGFLESVNRVIVAISRHKKKLIILGCWTIISNSFFKPLIDNSLIILNFGKDLNNYLKKYGERNIKFVNLTHDIDFDVDILYIDSNFETRDKNTLDYFIDSNIVYLSDFTKCDRSLEIGEMLTNFDGEDNVSVIFVCVTENKEQNYTECNLREALYNVRLYCEKNKIKTIKLPNPCQQFWIDQVAYYSAVYSAFRFSEIVILLDEKLLSQFKK